FVRWAQRDRCFLSSFPLVIYCHFHHVISVDNCGPDHYLNLIGLCANHHGMLENLKRTRNPSNSIIGTIHPKMMRWHYKAKAALAEFDALASGPRKAMNQLLNPYWKSDDLVCGIFEKHEPSIKLPLARMVINHDIELLKEINSLRPRIFFPSPTITTVGSDPYSLLLTDQVELQTAIDQLVSTNVHNIGDEEYDHAIVLHLLKLGLSGSLDSHEKNVRFHFTTELTFSVREIREMSENQIYSL